MINRVEFSARAEKDLFHIPPHIQDKLDAWIESVETIGLLEVRKIPGFHDEPLQGKRFGQRSIRLNLSYRAIYRIVPDGPEKFVRIEEISKHEY